MNEDVVTIRPDVTLRDAARELANRDIGSVVVREDDRPTGILTEGDVTRLFADDVAPDTPVREVMSHDLLTIDRDATVHDAARRLRDNTVKKLPVCEEGRLVGILTTTDLSNYVPHIVHAVKRAVEPLEPERQPSHRPDTAYEDEDWRFEYVGHEETIDVGDRLRFSKRLTEADVEAFAEASGDTNRLHLDDAYAAETRFRRRIVHGTLVAGVVSAALARLPGLIIYLSQEVTYLGPVDVNDRVTAECEVMEDLGEEKYRLSTRVLDGDEETVIDGEATVLADPIPDVEH